MSYAFLYSVLTTMALPLALARALINREWRMSLPERMGRGGYAQWLARKSPNRTIWFHGASVGEVVGLEPVILDVLRLDTELQVFVSTTSLTGRAEAKERGLCDTPCLLPLDHPLFVSRAIAAVRPSLVVIAETELWPGLLAKLRAEEIPVILINGRISDLSYPNYLKLRRLLRPMLGVFSKLLTQTALDKERFVSLGAAADLVEVAGSTKYDSRERLLSDKQRSSLAGELGLSRDKPCFVAGSVHPGEAGMVLDSYAAAQSQVADLQLIIAPRHPARFDDMALLLKQRGIEFGRRSAGLADSAQSVVLLDTLGELRSVYSLATVAFVGGTFIPLGGHNPFEAIAYGCAVILGPHYGNVRDAVSQLLERDAVVIATSGEQLSEQLLALLTDSKRRSLVAQRAQDVWSCNHGATAQIVEEIGRHVLLSGAAGLEQLASVGK